MHLSSLKKITGVLFLSAIFLSSLLFSTVLPLPTHAQSFLKALTPFHSLKQTSCGTWSVVPSLNPGSINMLNGVVVLSATDVWAVGSSNSNGFGSTLVEHFTVTSWSLVSSPNVSSGDNTLNGIARVPGSNQLWAVGRYEGSTGPSQTLIEFFNGSVWSVVPSPNVGSGNNALYGIAVISARNAWAVGFSSDSIGGTQYTLAMHWNGTSWKVVTSPNVGSSANAFESLTRVPGSNQLWAVGYYENGNNPEQTLIEQWNGTHWNVISSPNPGTGTNALGGVTAVSASNIWAVGQQYTTGTFTLIEHWNGSTWSVIPSPNPATAPNFTLNILQAVTIVSASNIWAVGQQYITTGYQPLIEHWDGSTWSVVANPTLLPGQNGLGAVGRVPGSTSIWAVGFASPSGGYPQTLTEAFC